jgi:hypothetical protein
LIAGKLHRRGLLRLHAERGGKIKANRKEAKDLAEPMEHDRHGARGHMPVRWSTKG